MPLSVSQYVNKQFFSKTVLGIFLKFYGKLEGLKSQKLINPNFSVKFSFWETSVESPPKYNPLFYLFCNLKNVDGSVSYDFAKTPHVWEKSGSLVTA